MDRQIIGVVVKREINRRFGSVSQFMEATQGISRRTVERIMRGDATIMFANLERVEGALDLPRDSLSLIGLHDFDELRAIGAEADLVRWIEAQAQVSRTADSPGSAAS